MSTSRTAFLAFLLVASLVFGAHDSKCSATQAVADAAISMAVDGLPRTDPMFVRSAPEHTVQFPAYSADLSKMARKAVSSVESITPSWLRSARGSYLIGSLKYRAATPEQRVLLVEELGEAGARKYAASNGLQPIDAGLSKGIRQGLDQVYSSSDGRIHVIEAKGGRSHLDSEGYGGLRQGTPERAVAQAEFTLHSKAASEVQRTAARKVIEAARSKSLDVHVIRTRHMQGWPEAPCIESSLESGDEAARLAKLVKLQAAVATEGADLANIATKAEAAAPELATAGKVLATTEKALATTSKCLCVAAPAAIALDVGVRTYKGFDIEQRYDAGEIDQQGREIEHAKNGGGFLGALGGGLIGFECGAAAGSCVAPGPGTAIGGVVGAVGGAIAGEAGATAAAEWTTTKIHETGTTISEQGTIVWDRTKHTTNVIASSCSNAAERTWDSTKDIAQSVGSGCSNAAKWSGSKIRSSWRWISGDREE